MRAAGLTLRALAAGAIASGGALLATGVATAESAASVQSAWWNEAAAGPVSAPPTASNGQLQVSSGVRGPLAFAAVRIGIPGGIDPATASFTLTLVQAANRAVGTVAVSACPTTSSWSPGDGQAAGSAPGYDCTKGKEADAVDSDGQDTFDIPAGWASGPSVAVAIVPTPGATTPFSVQYADPTTQSVRLSGSPAVPPTSSAADGTPSGSGLGQPAPTGPAPTSPSPGGPSAPAPPSSPGLQPAIAVAGPSDLGTSAAGAVPGPLPATGGVVSGSAPALAPPGGGPASQAPGASVSTSRSLAAATPLSGPGRAGRILAVSVLLLLGVVMFGLSGQPGRSPRLLLNTVAARGAGAPAAEPPSMGGIGRFAKPRTGPPQRL